MRWLQKLVLGPGSLASDTGTNRLCLHLACTQSDTALATLSARFPQLTVPLRRMRAVRERMLCALDAKCASLRDGSCESEQAVASRVQAMTKSLPWRNAIFGFRAKGRTCLCSLSAKQLWQLYLQLDTIESV